MVDLANIAYYPRIFDLAHRFFEDSWEPICGIKYSQLILERQIGFPVVHVESDFIAPLRYGDTVTATIWIHIHECVVECGAECGSGSTFTNVLLNVELNVALAPH